MDNSSQDVEIGWVVEHGNQPKYLTASFSNFEWTYDSLKAIRFCRQEDAERVAKACPFIYDRVAEHMWVKKIT